MGKIIKLDTNESEALRRCAALLKSGAVLILPFDTVYGFCCDANNNQAIEKIYRLKKREINKTIGVAVGGINQLQKLAIISDNTGDFVKARTPGKYTFILNSRDKINISKYCLKNGTIAIRIPESNFIRKVINSSGLVIAQTSANVAGGKEINRISDLMTQFDKINSGVDLIVDGGEIKNPVPSKIIDLTSEEPKEVER